MRFRTFLLAVVCVGLAIAVPTGAQTDIARTVHNLTPEGPGAVKEKRTIGLCVFCHTPHNASPQQALWNRDASGVTYKLYASSTTRAELNQPTGSSRLCLSCHDGTLALGSLRVPPQGDALKLGPMKGPNVIGTDLSVDHPVSFVYDGALAARHPGLVDPVSLPRTVRLDGSKQMQCTACHDPHESKRAKFLRMDTARGALCLTCHRLPQWASSAHATSLATWKGGGQNPWPKDGPNTVADNACDNCHRTHSAGHGPRLMTWSMEADNCNVCHNGQVAAKNVAAEFTKSSRHPIDAAQWTHDPQESPATMSRHVACPDCHDAHSVRSATAGTQRSSSLQGVSGVATDGSTVPAVTRDYEVCLKCHGSREPPTRGLLRVDTTRAVGSKIDPGSRSYHPIAAVGRNNSTKGLLPGYGSGSVIGCIDCHNNSDWTAGGTAPKGSHGSRYAPLLERNYETGDPTPESPASYAICYKCHDRGMLVRDAIGGFTHKKHVVDRQAPCAVCHDAHGSRLNAHLINFMTRDSSGKSVVTANRVGRLEYLSTVPGKGTCSLSCHGSDHAARSY